MVENSVCNQEQLIMNSVIRSFFEHYVQSKEDLQVDQIYRLKLLILLLFNDLSNERDKNVQLSLKFDELNYQKYSCEKCKLLRQTEISLKQLETENEALKLKIQKLEDDKYMPDDDEIAQILEDDKNDAKNKKKHNFKFVEKKVEKVKKIENQVKMVQPTRQTDKSQVNINQK